MGVVAFDEKGDMVDNMVELQWKRRELFPKSISYGCRSRFVIQANLPCEVIFGKHDPHEMLPGYPSPFEGAIKKDFDQSYGFSKPRTNSWAIVRKSFSWGSDKSKARSTKASSDIRMSSMPPTANTFDYHRPDRPEAVDNINASQDIHRGGPFLNVTSNLSGSVAEGEETTVIKNRDVHSAEIGTALAKIPSDESAELREANHISDAQISNFRGDAIAIRHGTESQKDDSEIALKPSFPQEIASTHTLAISETPEIVLLKPCKSDPELQQSRLAQPGDDSMFIEPAGSFGRSQNIPPNRELVNLEDERKGVKDSADREVIRTHILPGEGDRPEVLNPGISTRTPENAKEENSRMTMPTQNASDLEAWSSSKWLKQEPDWALRESNDSGVAFRKSDIRQNSLQSIEVKPNEPLRTPNSQSVDHESQDTTDPQARIDNFKLYLEYQYSKDPRSASQKAIDVLTSREQQPSTQSEARTKLEKQTTGQTRTDPHDTMTGSIDRLSPEQSHESLAKSHSSLDYSVATERPAQSIIATPLIEPNLLRGKPMAEGQSIVPEVKQHSERSRRSTNSRSKKRIKSRGKAPRIRSWKGESSQKGDLIPAKGADEYWEYDEKVKAYYHIDSDTGSTFWYEDSSDESEV